MKKLLMALALMQGVSLNAITIKNNLPPDPSGNNDLTFDGGTLKQGQSLYLKSISFVAPVILRRKGNVQDKVDFYCDQAGMDCDQSAGQLKESCTTNGEALDVCTITF